MRPVNGYTIRVHAVLTALLQHSSVASAAQAALEEGQACATTLQHQPHNGYTSMYTLLYETAERLNPYHGKSKRRLCRTHAHKSKACAYAQTFYLLSEGLYDNVQLPSLT